MNEIEYIERYENRELMIENFEEKKKQQIFLIVHGSVAFRLKHFLIA